jgi:hypothetical protein
MLFGDGRADPSRVYDLSVDNFVGMSGWFGADDQPYQIWMTHTPPRGVLLDVAGTLGVDVLEPGYGIGEKDLRACLKHQGSELRPGDVVLIRTCRMRLWPDRAASSRGQNAPGVNPQVDHPGLPDLSGRRQTI